MIKITQFNKDEYIDTDVLDSLIEAILRDISSCGREGKSRGFCAIYDEVKALDGEIYSVFVLGVISKNDMRLTIGFDEVIFFQGDIPNEVINKLLDNTKGKEDLVSLGKDGKPIKL